MRLIHLVVYPTVMNNISALGKHLLNGNRVLLKSLKVRVEFSYSSLYIVPFTLPALHICTFGSVGATDKCIGKFGDTDFAILYSLEIDAYKVVTPSAWLAIRLLKACCLLYLVNDISLDSTPFGKGVRYTKVVLERTFVYILQPCSRMGADNTLYGAFLRYSVDVYKLVFL